MRSTIGELDFGGFDRLSGEASAEEQAAMTELQRQYIAKERCGVFPEAGIEYYLLAKSHLTSALTESCGSEELPEDQLLVVAVHLKVRKDDFATSP